MKSRKSIWKAIYDTFQNKKIDQSAPMISPKGDERIYDVENALTDRDQFYQNRHLPEDMMVNEMSQQTQIQYC